MCTGFEVLFGGVLDTVGGVLSGPCRRTAEKLNDYDDSEGQAFTEVWCY